MVKLESMENTGLALRKEDHLSMAQASQTEASMLNQAFDYEPLLSAHPDASGARSRFAEVEYSLPLWISSMTGGAQHARALNTMLARAAETFKLGMGLGSCRPLLEERQTKADFDMRPFMPTRPLFANLGIAQVEKLQLAKREGEIHAMVDELKATGLIIHVNPLQEFFQPGGDHFTRAPLETISEFVARAPYPVMVKEVGHGMGPRSLQALMRLPLYAIEFGAFGGTNFSILEARRAKRSEAHPMIYVGHTAQEMTAMVRQLLRSDENFKCRRFIVSGGVRDVLEAYGLTSQLPEALYGQAAGLLSYAEQGEAALFAYIESQIQSFALARAFLRAKSGDLS